MRYALLGFALFPLLAACSRDAAESGRVAKVRDSCQECGPTLTRVTMIDGRRTLELTGTPRTIARDRHGRIFLSVSVEVPSVFDSAGQFVGPFSRRGQGPGEIQRSFWIDAGRDDSVRVFSSPKVNVYGPDLQFVRSFFQDGEYGPPSRVAYLSDGNVAFSTTRIDREMGGQPIRIANAAWTVIRSLDLRDEARTVGSPLIGAARSEGRFWGVRLLPAGEQGYEIPLFDQTGNSVRVLTREPSWWITQPQGETDVVVSMALHVREDAAGRLIVVSAHPKTNWRAIPADPRGRMGPRYDTVVEIIDPVGGRLLGTRRVPGWPLAILDDRHIAISYEIEDEPVVEIWRLSK